MGRGYHLGTRLLISAIITIAAATGLADEPTPTVIDVTQPLINALEPVPTTDVEQPREDITPVETKSVVRIDDPIEDKAEVIHERYPNRSVKISREVIQDDSGNYINHGQWKLYDPKGHVIAEGQYHYGKRHGKWTRWHNGNDSPLFAAPPYKPFEGPFVSQASFENGKLHGTWIIIDSKKRKASEWEFVDGIRHGATTWFYPNGRKMHSVVYRDGIVDGQMFWNVQGQMTGDDTFDMGRKLDVKVTYYKGSKQKKLQGGFLHSKIVKKTDDDWWNAHPATFTTSGKEEKHGAWTMWYSNGQIAQQGKFEYGVPVGQFTWWYSNGQKALEGTYDNGQPTERWVWWHQNGQKKTDGRYIAGTPTGPWSWWKTDGKLTHRADFSDSAANVAARPQQEKKEGEASVLKQPAPAIPLPAQP